MRRHMQMQQVVVRAAWVRVGLAVAALAVLPIRFPALAHDRPVFVAYLIWTLAVQALVSRHVGGTKRSFVAGVVDLAVLTFGEVGRRFDAAHPVTASVGVAMALPDDTVASLLRRADENSYGAKRAGGNRVVMTA